MNKFLILLIYVFWMGGMGLEIKELGYMFIWIEILNGYLVIKIVINDIGGGRVMKFVYFVYLFSNMIYVFEYFFY